MKKVGAECYAGFRAHESCIHLTLRGKGMVGAKGFEPSTSWSRTRRASQAALRPDRKTWAEFFHPKLDLQISTAAAARLDGPLVHFPSSGPFRACFRNAAFRKNAGENKSPAPGLENGCRLERKAESELKDALR